VLAAETAIEIRFTSGEDIMSDIAYVSKVRIERKVGPLRIAYLRGESQAATFSVHGAIAKHYKIAPAALNESHASTLDYVNCRLNGGHIWRPAEACQIDASKLTADITGEVETEEGVLVIRRIHVKRLAAPADLRGKVDRVHEMYAMHCPLFRILDKAIQPTSSSTLGPPPVGSSV
jgi:hypothetical protein